MRFTHKILAASVSLLVLAACSDNDGGATTAIQQTKSTLRTVDNSEEFYAVLKEGLINSAAGTYYSASNQGGIDGSTVATGAGTTGSTDGGGGTTGTVAESTADLSAGGTAQVNNVTGTNVQEVGVDEQDRVKADEQNLYILAGSSNSYFIDTDLAASSQFYEPQPHETLLRILSLDPSAPDATAVASLGLDLSGQYPEGMYLHPTSSGQNVFVTSSGISNIYQYWNDPYAYARQESIITRVDVSDPANAKVAEDFRIDGAIISSRRIGSNLILASRFYPEIRGVEPYSVTEEEYTQLLDSTDLSTLLPSYTKSSSGATAPLVDPAGCFVAPDKADQSYFVPNIVTLSVIDLNTMDLTSSTCYVGDSETVYASPNAIYLATTRWGYVDVFPFEGFAGDGTAGTASGAPVADSIDPRERTDIHEFKLVGSKLNYNGSGSVVGHLGWNNLRKPFRMSEKDGYLRVATYTNDFATGNSPVNVSILKANGSGTLETLGQIPNEQRPQHIGKPGEQLYASRFVGDKAYLVTFRQTDPLYVVDLANPSDPFLAGELEIDGYSDYLQPISEDYVLGIGKDAVAADDGWGDGRGALEQGIKLALFDVSNAAVPTEVQSLIVGQRGSHSSALNDHRAITIQAATNEHPTRVAFAIDIHGEPLPTVRPTSATAWNYYERNYSGLHGFEVRTGADAGISLTGVLKPSGNASPYSYGYQDRSVIYNDAIYYIRENDVFAAPWGQMDNFVGPR